MSLKPYDIFFFPFLLSLSFFVSCIYQRAKGDNADIGVYLSLLVPHFGKGPTPLVIFFLYKLQNVEVFMIYTLLRKKYILRIKICTSGIIL